MSVLIARVRDYRDFLRERLSVMADKCAIPVPSTSGALPKVVTKPETARKAKGGRNLFYDIRPFNERTTFPKVIVRVE